MTTPQTEIPGLQIGQPPVQKATPSTPVEEAVYVEPTPEETAEQPQPEFQQPAPSQDPRIQQLYAALAQQQQQQVLQQIAQQAQTYVQQLVEAGWNQQDAQQEASRQIRTYALEQAVQGQEAQIQEYWKQRVAQHFAQQYGVDANVLMGAATGEAMRQIAQHLSRGNQLDQRVARVERNQYTPQRYDSNRGSGRGIPVTTQNIDVLYNQGRVSDAVYRHFLNTGQIRRL